MTQLYQAGPLDAPSKKFEAVTPSDSADLTYTTRGLYIGVGGDVVSAIHLYGAALIDAPTSPRLVVAGVSQ